MSEFIEIISPLAEQQIKDIMIQVDKLAKKITDIPKFQLSNTPSGSENNINKLTGDLKAQNKELDEIKKRLLTITSLNKQRYQEEAKLIADHDKAIVFQTQNELKAEKALTQSKISEAKARLSLISSLNKQRYSEEATLTAGAEKAMLHKYQEELKQIKAKQSLIYSLGKQQQQQAEQEAKWSRTGASSVIPGMSQKISDLKATQQSVLANEKLSRAYVELTTRREKAKNKLQDLIASEQASTAEIRKAQKEFDILNKKVASADKAVGRFSDANRKINGLASSVGNLMTAFGVGTGIYLAMDIGKSIYNTTKELQSLNLALKMVSGTNKEYAENQSFVQQVSEKWGLEVKSLTQQYTQFYTASKGLLSQESIKTTFEGIAKAGSVMGLSLEKQKDAFYAIDQMMSKGNVTAEELKKQLGNAMPGAIKAAAMAYQELHPQIKTIQEAEKGLYEAMKKGALDSATYVPLIVKNLNKIYGIEMLDKVDTLQASQNRLQNSWTDLVKSMNESETGGISQFFRLIIDGATDAIKQIKRLNTEKADLFKQAREKGNVQGSNSYKKQFDELVGDKLTQKQRENIRKEIKETENLIKAGYDLSQEGEKNSEKLRRLHQKIGTGTAEEVNLTLRKDAYKNIIIQQKRLNELKAESDNYSTLLGGKGGRGISFINKDIEEANRLLGFYESVSKSAINYKEIVKTTPPPNGETKEEQKARLKAEKDFAKEREQLLKDQYDAELSNLTLRKESLSDHLKNEKNFNQEEISIFKFGTDENIKYSMKLAQSEIAIAELVYKEKKRLAEKEIKDRKLTPKQGENLMTVIDNEFAKSTADALQSSADRNIKTYETFFKSLNDTAKIEGDAFEKSMDKFKLTPEQEKELERIAKLLDKSKEDIKNYIASFQVELGHNLGFDETADFFLKMDEDGRTMFDKLNQMADGSKEKQIATFQAIAESAQEMFNFISNASQENFDQEYARLEKQKEVRLKFAGDSDSAKKKIEEDYEKRRKEIAVREFKAKQKMAIVNIAIDTAQAIAATVGKTGFFGIPLTAIVGALGAAQIAIVASQKIPEYWKGTDSAEAGLAWTNERGAEIVTDKAGHIKDFGDNKGAKLTMMEKGDKVYTSEQTKKLMFNNELNSIMMDNGIGNTPQIVFNSGITKAEIEEVMMKTLGSMSQESTIIDGDGFKRVISNGHSRTITNNNRVSGRGIRV
ncbi:tape measure protein [Flavobacterium sp.]|uniref:tape measure protein n=1 Tax=Flavobacterium sp. TaxID=239 RepID=UPI0038FC42BA